MLFINKNNKITPKIYIIDFGGYFNNVFEGLFVNYGPCTNLESQILVIHQLTQECAYLL